MEAQPTPEQQTEARPRMSPREREVLAYVARGLSSREIARELGLSPSTVDTHVRSAMTKLGARTRAQAALLAASGPRELSAPPPARDAELTAEQRRLLWLLANGMSRTAAAQGLGVSRRTVSRRLDEIRRILAVQTSTEAILLDARRTR